MKGKLGVIFVYMSEITMALFFENETSQAYVKQVKITLICNSAHILC